MVEKIPKSSEYDYVLLIPVLLLVNLGLLVIYSSSCHIAEYRFGDSFFFLKRQAFYCLAGLGLMIAAKNIPSSLYLKLVYPLLLISVFLLILLHIPGFGNMVNGATRWLKFFGISFQPSELTKFSLVVYMAYSMSKKDSKMGSFSTGLLPHLLVTGIFVFLIGLQPDIGTGVIIVSWTFIVLFVGGANLFQIFSVSIISTFILWQIILQADYRIHRLLAFIDPWKDPLGIGYHIIHSFLAFGSGGIVGAGLGDGKQKLFYLPEPHTDFILSSIGEELGFFGVTAVIVLFCILIMRGIKVALNARDLHGTYLALGLICFIGLQAVVNMAVSMGLLATTGLTLPFVSYGGSSLVFSLLSIGILLSISSRN